MSSTTQEQLLRFFKEAAGTTASERAVSTPSEASSPTTDSGASDGYSTAPVSETPEPTSYQAGQSYSATPLGTSVAGGAETAKTTGGTGATIESALTTFVEGGFGIVPLVSGLLGLLGGGSPAPPKLEKYERPSSIDFVSAETPNGLAAADYDQMGMPRLAETALPTSAVMGDSQANSPDSNGSVTVGSGASAGQNGTAVTQMTLNIQAMDAQSIMDRSSEIAHAVRSAMLNMSSINDVIGDL